MGNWEERASQGAGKQARKFGESEFDYLNCFVFWGAKPPPHSLSIRVNLIISSATDF